MMAATTDIRLKRVCNLNNVLEDCVHIIPTPAPAPAPSWCKQYNVTCHEKHFIYKGYTKSHSYKTNISRIKVLRLSGY